MGADVTMREVIAIFDIGKTNGKLYRFNDKFQMEFQIQCIKENKENQYIWTTIKS